MTTLRTAILGAAVMLVAGCSTVQKEEPKVLRLPAVAPSTPGQLNSRSISVAQVLAGGAVGERRYVHTDRTAPGEVHQAATLFWDEPPPRLVERTLVSSLRQRFQVVSGPEVTIDADQRVVVRLDRFEEQNGGAQPAAAFVAFDATVTRVSNRSVAFAGRYCGAAPLPGFEPSDRALAFATALSQASLRLADDIASGAASGGGC